MALAETLTQSGIPYPVAVEIARQMVAGVGNATNLMNSGVSSMAAVELVKQINAVSFSSHNLSMATWNPAVAKAIKDNSGH